MNASRILRGRTRRRGGVASGGRLASGLRASHPEGQDASRLCRLDEFGARFTHKMRHIDPRHGIIRNQPDDLVMDALQSATQP